MCPTHCRVVYREILGGEQDLLFRDQKVTRLEALRRLTAGHGLGNWCWTVHYTRQ